jgi:stearoyl-CoA desaturase (Delta-9 desaturase)
MDSTTDDGPLDLLRHPRSPSRRSQRTNRAIIALTHIVPSSAVLFGVVAALVYGYYPTALDLTLCGVFFLLTMIGLEVGYHRLFCHGAFKTSVLMERVLAVLGTMAFHGGVIWWVATHKRHHAFSDRDGDPHSPHLPPRNGGYRGFIYGHLGWMLEGENLGIGPWSKHVLPMYQDKFLFFLNRNYFSIGFVGLLVPFLLGLIITRSWEGALTALIWGGLIRVFLVNNAIYSLNSFCHMMGSRDFTVMKDDSRNNIWLALYTIGGSWHNNHHAFPRTASNQFRWWQFDLAGILITAAENLGIAWDVNRPTREQIEARKQSSKEAPYST